MTDPTITECFSADLESLCRRYGVTLSYSSRDECLTITPAAEQGGGVDVHVELREPPKPYVPPPPTPEELARAAERESLAAASRETWLAGFSPTGPLEPAPRPVAAWEAAPDCNPTDGHTPACRARENLRTCSKAPNFVRLSDEIAWLRRELHAVRVLDAWAKKHAPCAVNTDNGPDSATIELYADGGDYVVEDFGATAAEARIAAAKALLEEDPNILEEPCKAG